MKNRTRERLSFTQAVTSIKVEASNGDHHYETFTTLNPRGQQTTDVVGNRNSANAFVSDSWDDTVGTYDVRIEQEWNSGGDPEEKPYDRYINTDYKGYFDGYPSYSLHESDIEFVTRAVADTNPSAADIDVPVFIAELRDVPSLFRNAAEKLSKASANEYLKFEYGIKPLANDIRRFLKVADQLAKRLERIRQARSNYGLVRKYLPPDRWETHQFTDEPVDYAEILNDRFGVKASGTVTIERWATIKWTPDFDPLGVPDTDEGLLRLAKRAVFGGTVDGATLWQAMPWSWLIDWSSNMGDYLASKRNIVGASPGEICLMKKTTINSSSYLYRKDQVDLPDYTRRWTMVNSPSKVAFVRKERLIDVKPAAITTGELDLLGGDVRKQSILGALSIQRLRGLKF